MIDLVPLASTKAPLGEVLSLRQGRKLLQMGEVAHGCLTRLMASGVFIAWNTRMHWLRSRRD